jgi:hypothetical protein
MSVAMPAPRPQRQRGEGEQAGAGADVGDVGEALARPLQPVERLEAARWCACWPVPKARPASIRKLIAPGSGACARRVDEEAAGADRLQPGLAAGHPILVGELLDPARRSPSRPAPPVRPRRLLLEIGVDQPVVGAMLVGLVGDEHRRVGMSLERVVHLATASPSARVQAGSRASSFGRGLLGQPLVELPWSGGRIVAARPDRTAAAVPAKRSAMLLADGCGVSRMSHSSAATLAMLARKAATTAGWSEKR